MTIRGDASGDGDGVGLGLGVGVGVTEGVGVGLGLGLGVGVGVGVGAFPPMTTETGLLCAPSAVTINVEVPEPLNSEGINR